MDPNLCTVRTERDLFVWTFSNFSGKNQTMYATIPLMKKTKPKQAAKAGDIPEKSSASPQEQKVDGKTTEAVVELLAKQPAGFFTKALAEEIVKGLTSFSKFTTRFRHEEAAGASGEEKAPDLGDHPVLVDTSVLVDGRILPIV